MLAIKEFTTEYRNHPVGIDAAAPRFSWKFDFLGWPKVVLADPWNALRIITRAQTIHECLHLLYTDFPGRQVADPKCDTRNKKIIMGMISKH